METVAVRSWVVPSTKTTCSVYVIVCVGETACDPFAATAFPFSVTALAPCVPHVSVADAPAETVVGFAANTAFFATGAGCTVIDAVKSFSLPSGRTTCSVYVVSSVGVTTWVECRSICSPNQKKLLAPSTSHLSVADCPAMIVVGVIENENDGGVDPNCGICHGWGVTAPPPTDAM